MTRHIHCGINIDLVNEHGNPSAREIQELGATWVRFTFKDLSAGPHPTRFSTYDDRVREFNQAGIDMLMILGYETYPGKPAYDANLSVWEAYISKFAARCRQIALHYGDRVRAYQIWNEPDYRDPKPTYDPRAREKVFGSMLRAVFGAIKEASSATVVVGGLVSGDPSYLERVRAATGDGVLHADVVGVHPYGQRPTEDWPAPGWGMGLLSDLVRRYHATAHKPIWITEIGIDDDSVQGEFPERAFTALNEELAQEAPYAFWFCWSDGMVSPYGLLRVDAQKKASYTSFQTFARQPMVKEPPEPPPVVDYHSHYVLFPQGTPWSWYDASRHYLVKFRATRGESCNDAARAHGTLGHVITCINPTPEVVEYLKQLNPNASLDFIYAQTTDDLEDIMDHRADIGEPW
jgi:hypothetical protein